MTSADFHDRLLSRAAYASLNLASDLIDRLETYYRLLKRWNHAINLSSLALEPLSDAAIDRLLIEPLAAARYIPDRPLKWLDLGSGSGSPAIPLKLARSAADLTMIEARSRKAAFLREVVRELRLSDTEVVGERFEVAAERADLAQSASCLTARAVRIDVAFLGSAHRLLRSDGRLVVFGAVLPAGCVDPRFQVVRTSHLPKSDLESRVTIIALIG